MSSGNEKNMTALLAEGYQTTREEDLTLTKDFENADFDLRPFGLAAGEFVVPDDFDAPLPEKVLAAFESE
jgi:hypothetical protein